MHAPRSPRALHARVAGGRSHSTLAMCRPGTLLSLSLLLGAALTVETKKSAGKKLAQRQIRRNAKQQQSGNFEHLDSSWTSRPHATGNNARLMSRYSLGAGQPDALPMAVESELMHRWEEARVPSKPPEVARGTADPLLMQSSRKQGVRKQALNKRDWLLTDQLPPEAEVETLIDDPITGTRIATISHFVNASEIARLVELIDLAPTWAQQRLSVDQRAERGYRYTYVGANEDEVVMAVEDRMAAISGLPAHPKESRLMVSEYLSLPQSHPYFPLNNVHIDIDAKPDRVATFVICAHLPYTNLRSVHSAMEAQMSVLLDMQSNYH